MDELRQWAITIMLCALAGAVVYIAAPEGSTKKAVRVLVSIFFLVALLSPFISGDGIDIDLDLDKKYDSRSVTDNRLQENISRQLLIAAKESTIEKINAILYSYKIYDGQIDADMDINGDGSIFIKSITIIIGGSEKSAIEAVQKAIQKEFGINAEIKLNTET